MAGILCPLQNTFNFAACFQVSKVKHGENTVTIHTITSERSTGRGNDFSHQWPKQKNQCIIMFSDFEASFESIQYSTNKNPYNNNNDKKKSYEMTVNTYSNLVYLSRRQILGKYF